MVPKGRPVDDIGWLAVIENRAAMHGRQKEANQVKLRVCLAELKMLCCKPNHVKSSRIFHVQRMSAFAKKKERIWRLWGLGMAR